MSDGTLKEGKCEENALMECKECEYMVCEEHSHNHPHYDQVSKFTVEVWNAISGSIPYPKSLDNAKITSDKKYVMRSSNNNIKTRVFQHK